MARRAEALATEAATRAEESTDHPEEILLNRRLGYNILRLTLGLNFYLHGSTRITRGVQQNFIDKYESQYATTILPVPVAHLALTVIPYIEVVIGVLLFVGLWTRWSLVASALLMFVLVFGTAIRQDWNALFIQMLYVLINYMMLVALNSRINCFSLDAFFSRRRKS